jgi:hypothetical protein
MQGEVVDEVFGNATKNQKASQRGGFYGQGIAAGING